MLLEHLNPLLDGLKCVNEWCLCDYASQFL